MATERPLTKTILGVTLMHGQFRALAVVNGRTTGSWEYPHRVESVEELRLALQEAISATHFPGHLVSFVVEDARMVHQYHLVPPMDQADLERYLGRMANHEKLSEDPVVWRSRKALRTNERTGLLLDVWPRPFVEEVVGVCKDLNLTPLHLLPISAVFVDQVRILAAEPEDVLLLVTRATEKIVFVVATGEGVPLFDRYLNSPHESSQDPERIAREIIRTVLFAKQQLGQQIHQVWIMGETEELSVDRLQPFMEMPIYQSPMSPDPLYWNWVGMTLPPNHASNFFTKDVRRVRIRKVMSKVTAGVLAWLVCVSVSTTGLVEGILIRDQSLERTVAHESKAQLQEKQRWQARVQDLEANRAWVQAFSAQDPPPVAGWFLGYVAGILPKEIILTEISVIRKDSGWEVELVGQAPKDFRVSAKDLTELERHLQEGPYHLDISKGWKESLLAKLRQGGRTSERQDPQRFSISGRIL